MPQSFLYCTFAEYHRKLYIAYYLAFFSEDRTLVFDIVIAESFNIRLRFKWILFLNCLYEKGNKRTYK